PVEPRTMECVPTVAARTARRTRTRGSRDRAGMRGNRSTRPAARPPLARAAVSGMVAPEEWTSDRALRLGGNRSEDAGVSRPRVGDPAPRRARALRVPDPRGRAGRVVLVHDPQQ